MAVAALTAQLPSVGGGSRLCKCASSEGQGNTGVVAWRLLPLPPSIWAWVVAPACASEEGEVKEGQRHRDGVRVAALNPSSRAWVVAPACGKVRETEERAEGDMRAGHCCSGDVEVAARAAQLACVGGGSCLWKCGPKRGQEIIAVVMRRSLANRACPGGRGRLHWFVHQQEQGKVT